MTLQELLASSLERLGAAGIAPAASTTEDKLFRSVADLRAPLEGLSYYVIRANQIVVWASADGTLFPSAKEVRK